MQAPGPRRFIVVRESSQHATAHPGEEPGEHTAGRGPCRRPLAAFALLAGGSFWAFRAFDPLSRGAPPAALESTLDRGELREAVRLSAGFLARSADAQGRFAYRVHLDPEVTPAPKYNILRHAGAMYALGQICGLEPGHDDARDALLRAGDFLLDHVSPLPEEGSEILAVWSRPEINHDFDPVEAKLGGTGLGLVALLALHEQDPDAIGLPELRALGDFLVSMQKDDGSFYSKYIPDTGGPNDEWVSLYYPGEAALGLLMLYEVDPDPAWLQTAANAMLYLARLREGRKQVEADHWALIATGRLLPLYDRFSAPGTREAILAHAVQICESILGEQARQLDRPELVGCFTHDGRTTPTATRLEGLLAALTFLPEDAEPLRTHVRASVELGLAFLLRAQVREGEHAGAIPRAVPLAPEVYEGNESFEEREGEVRIDYVQHALSAMIMYLEGVPE